MRRDTWQIFEFTQAHDEQLVIRSDPYMKSIPQLCPDETCASCFFEHGVCLRAVFAHFDW